MKWIGRNIHLIGCLVYLAILVTIATLVILGIVALVKYVGG